LQEAQFESEIINTMKGLREMFPRASEACLLLNAATLSRPGDKNAISAAARGKKRGFMNKTEAEFALRLEGMKRQGEIQRWEYEGITLRWAGIRYTPDFYVLEKLVVGAPQVKFIQVKFIEVKSAFIKGKFERAVERFRHARTYWPEFQFEMWQRKGGQWKRLF